MICACDLQPGLEAKGASLLEADLSFVTGLGANFEACELRRAKMTGAKLPEA